MKVDVYNQEGAKAGTREVADKVFNVDWNSNLVHVVVTSLESSKRAGTAHAKGRSEVRGGGKKPWAQKGTGRARHGSIRSPIWIGGGVTHGPINKKNYERKTNKNSRRKALYTVLSKKLSDKEVFFIDNVKFSEPKTKLGHAFVKKFGKTLSIDKFGVRGSAVFFLIERPDKVFNRALRNISHVEIGEARNLNVLEALKSKYLVFLSDADKRLILK